MSFEDVTRSTAYFKCPDYAKALDAWCQNSQCALPSAIATHCAVCRVNLLFEIELDAISDL
jgi:hypothetical protein